MGRLRWSAFGIAIGIVGITVMAQLDARRGFAPRVLDIGLVLTAGTAIAATVVFAEATMTWLVVALALGTAQRWCTAAVATSTG